MPAGSTVRPQKWSNVINLYDDNKNSAIWGIYDTGLVRCLGVRWNNDYPQQSGYSLRYVEPPFVTKNILLELLSRVNNDPSLGNINNILLALQEHKS